MYNENTVFQNSHSDYSHKTPPTAEAFDFYLDSIEGEKTGSDILEAACQIFGIDIELAAVLHPEYSSFKSPKEAIGSYLKKHGANQSGAEIRSMIKLLFGMNLVGISELYKDRINLYSKNQWLVKNDQSLFLVHTGETDIDVKILPTPYFTKQTGLMELPQKLQQALASLGFAYNEKEQAIWYSDPGGQPVSGEFKVQTMKTIAEIVHSEYSTL